MSKPVPWHACGYGGSITGMHLDFMAWLMSLIVKFAVPQLELRRMRVVL